MATAEVDHRPALPPRTEVWPSAPQVVPFEFTNPKTLSLYGLLTGLYERIVAQEVEGITPPHKLTTQVPLDQLPDSVRNLTKGFHQIATAINGNHQATALSGSQEVRGDFYHTVLTPEDEKPLGVYVFDVSWRNPKDKEYLVDHFSVQVHENPNGKIIHAVKASYNGKLSDSASLNVAEDMSHDRQRELVEDLVTLFASQPQQPQPR